MAPTKQFVTKDSVRMKAVRASGPGGHMADRRSMKVQLWVEVAKLPISEAQKKMVREHLAHRINKKGELEVMCQEERSQEINRDIGLAHMNLMIADAVRVQKERIPTEAPRTVKKEGIRQRELRYTKKKTRRVSHAETSTRMRALKDIAE